MYIIKTDERVKVRFSFHFWVDFQFIWRLLKKTTGWLLIFLLGEKIISWACLETSGLNGIFHWYAYWEIFHKSSLDLFKEFKLSLTTAKIDVSAAKSLGWENNPLGKSFMYTKKNNGPKIDPCFDGRPLGWLTVEDKSLVLVFKKWVY